jgi:hypothetical protein
MSTERLETQYVDLHKELWLIDHGASLYFHHSWTNWKSTHKVLALIKDHVLLPQASFCLKQMYYSKKY